MKLLKKLLSSVLFLAGIISLTSSIEARLKSKGKYLYGRNTGKDQPSIRVKRPALYPIKPSLSKPPLPPRPATTSSTTEKLPPLPPRPTKPSLPKPPLPPRPATTTDTTEELPPLPPRPTKPPLPPRPATATDTTEELPPLPPRPTVTSGTTDEKLPPLPPRPTASTKQSSDFLSQIQEGIVLKPADERTLAPKPEKQMTEKEKMQAAIKGKFSNVYDDEDEDDEEYTPIKTLGTSAQPKKYSPITKQPAVSKLPSTTKSSATKSKPSVTGLHEQIKQGKVLKKVEKGAKQELPKGPTAKESLEQQILKAKEKQTASDKDPEDLEYDEEDWE